MSRAAGVLAVSGWHWETGVALPLLAGVSLYVVGAVRLRARRRHAPRNPSWTTSAFLAGIALLAVALLSSLDEVATELFTAHMVQHELLMALAAPLLVVSHPGAVLLWGLPAALRRHLGRAIASTSVRAAWRRLTRPLDAFVLHAAAIWVWHVPSLFQAALTNDAIHATQHVFFFATGLAYWSAILHPRRREQLGLSIVSLFGTAVHTAALGALLATSRVLWYPAYGNRALEWGLTPLQDQQLAGLVMWIPAGFVYLAAALLVVRRWMRRTPLSFENAQHLRSIT